MTVIWLLFAAVLCVCALTDIACYRIYNEAVLILLALFIVMSLINAQTVHWLDHFVPASVCLAATVILFLTGSMGAGDAKLLSVLALWAGNHALIPFLFWTALSGLGVILILVPARFALKGSAREDQLPRILRRKEGVPYGVAIAAGAIIASPQFPNWVFQI